jgi:4-hydroxy-tetrahydrodipicolinate reductase
MPENCSTKKVKIALVGASGKMGKLLTALAEKDDALEFADEADVVIDFSTPEGAKKAIAMGKPLVCGTTGLSEGVMEELRQLAKEVPVLYSPNFSVGVNLCFEILFLLKERAADAKILLEETHHTQKKDSPSGTAKKMAEILEVNEVTAHRQGDVVGTHKVQFLLEGETITLEHNALSREIYAIGALKAAKFLVDKSPGFYAFRDIFV